MDDEQAMLRAIALADGVRGTTSPNPWVGAVLCNGGDTFEGATSPPGGPHAEAVALARAGPRARRATLYTTLEPCAHAGRTRACADAIVGAGVRRVVVGVEDPDEHVHGRGIALLREAGVEVRVGVAAAEVEAQLAPYLKHRRCGLPFVVLKLAASLDGRIAAPDGSSRWITGDAARADAHGLRASSDAILVGAGTVRADDPELNVRLADGAASAGREPLRVVLGKVPGGARVSPAVEMGGDLVRVLADLGGRGVLQLLVEGGARVAHDFHQAGLVDRYVLYMAPALFGGDDGRALFAGTGAQSVDDLWRGRVVGLRRLGEDLRVDLEGREQPARRLAGGGATRGGEQCSPA